MSESRTLLLDSDIVEALQRAGQDVPSDEDILLLKTLPDALTQEEVDDIGLHVMNATEMQSPSKDGFSRGRRRENEAILMLGSLAANTGDLVTAISARQHLRRWPWTTTGIVGSLILGRNIKRSTKAIIDSLQNP